MAQDILLSDGKILKANEPIGGTSLFRARLIEAGRFGSLAAPSYAEILKRPVDGTRSDKGVTAEKVLALT